ncbi:MAG: triose-phosphate isomerase [Firmicutes bacterium]|nr:triose-phosphate isomerase [Bacillota bacterium]
MRKLLIAGNWKMNKTSLQAGAFCSELKNIIGNLNLRAMVAVFPPFTSILAVRDELKGSTILFGGQNVSFAQSGAYTGEISAAMLKEEGATLVIVGHSERRGMFADTDKSVLERAKQALNFDLMPIVCVGESLTDRQNNRTFDVLKGQIGALLGGLDRDDFKKIVIAYEPIWAIGTGLSASADEADEACGFIRGLVEQAFGLGQSISILYGGSLNQKNALDLLSKPNIDGGLIGGASLNAAEFAQIALIADKIEK